MGTHTVTRPTNVWVPTLCPAPLQELRLKAVSKNRSFYSQGLDILVGETVMRMNRCVINSQAMSHV